MYLLSIPYPIRWLYPPAIYEVQHDNEPTIYLTFDDGPIPTVTHFVLDCLATYEAKATFFMVGENVVKNPHIFQDVIDAGHAIGNHTQHHIKGMQYTTEAYIADVAAAAAYIPSKLFRPPYGKMKPKQAMALVAKGFSLVFWSLLSGDFDTTISADKCLSNVLDRIRPGDVVVFHDSVKAYPHLSYVLPQVLAYCQSKGWRMASLRP